MYRQPLTVRCGTRYVAGNLLPIVLEFVSGDGQEERDQTSYEGKFWVYDRHCVPFYGIYEVANAKVDVYHP